MLIAGCEDPVRALLAEWQTDRRALYARCLESRASDPPIPRKPHRWTSETARVAGQKGAAVLWGHTPEGEPVTRRIGVCGRCRRPFVSSAKDTCRCAISVTRRAAQKRLEANRG